MPDDTLAACHAYFVEAQYQLGAGQDRMIRAAKGRVALLNNELQIRSIERGSKDRHKETTGLERKILRWTRWAVLAAVVVPIALALLQDTRISSFLRAKA